MSSSPASGSVGARIIGQLHDLGVEVVGVDKSAEATGMPLARLTRRPGRHRRDASGGDTPGGRDHPCQAIVSVTDSDIVNLETALNARALAGSRGSSPAV